MAFDGPCHIAAMLGGSTTKIILDVWCKFLQPLLPKASSITGKIDKTTNVVILPDHCSYQQFFQWAKLKGFPKRHITYVTPEWAEQSIKHKKILPLDLYEVNWTTDNSATLDDHSIESKTPSVSVVKDKRKPKSHTNLNSEITDVLKELIKVYSAKNDTFRVKAYAKCVAVLEAMPERVLTSSQLKDISGFGKSILSKIDEIIRTGHLQKLDRFQSDPHTQSSIELCNIWGVGPVKAHKLMDQGILSVDTLRKVLESGDQEAMDKLLNHKQQIGLKHYDDLLSRIPRVEVEEIFHYVCDAVRELPTGIPELRYCRQTGTTDHKHRHHHSVSESKVPEVKELNHSCTSNATHDHGCFREFHLLNYDIDILAIVVGSYRRGLQTSGDIDILLVPLPLPNMKEQDTHCTLDILHALVNRMTQELFLVDNLTSPKAFELGKSSNYMGVCRLPESASSSGTASEHTRKCRRIDLKVVPLVELPFALLYFTGSNNFNRGMRQFAHTHDYLLSNHGLFHFHEELLEHRSDSPGPYASPSTTQSFKRVPDKGTAVKGCKTESDVFAALGLPFIEPCHREFWDYSTGYNSSTESTKHKPYRETFHEHFPQEFEELLQTPDALAANNWLTSDEEKDQNSHGKRSNGDKKIANKKAKSVLETVPSIRIKHT